MIFLAGIISIIVFYIVILSIGIWAGVRFKGDTEVETMNAGRRLGYVVGTLTLVGTWAGGGYINGAAEKMFSSGLVKVQVPLGYSLALLVGALLFISKMRSGNYITLLDPFQFKYGYRYGAILIVPAVASEFFWCAAVLNSLGNALDVVLEVGKVASILISATFAGLYTLVGGLNSVTYTDVVQMFVILIGLTLSTPFALTNPAVDFGRIKYHSQWLGEIKTDEIAVYIDDMLLLIFGGIPWQGYFQRVFSIRSTKMAMKMSWLSMVGTLIIAIPALLLGLAAVITDWKKTGLGRDISDEDASMILPLTLRYLLPVVITVLALGAITGAVMSSADSAILASSAMFTRNVYKHLFRPKASDKELHWILRGSIVVTTILAAVIAMTMKSVYYLSFLCSDLVYVILFPQLLITLYLDKYVNIYGSSFSFFTGFLLRILAGEPILGIPVVTKYPFFEEKTKSQKFPFRTFIMLLSSVIFVSVSAIVDYIFLKRNLNMKYDILGAYVEKPSRELRISEDSKDER